MKDRETQRKTREKRAALVEILMKQNEELAQRVAQLQEENTELRHNFDWLWRSAFEQEFILRAVEYSGKKGYNIPRSWYLKAHIEANSLKAQILWQYMKSNVDGNVWNGFDVGLTGGFLNGYASGSTFFGKEVAKQTANTILMGDQAEKLLNLRPGS